MLFITSSDITTKYMIKYDTISYCILSSNIGAHPNLGAFQTCTIFSALIRGASTDVNYF